MQLIKVNLFAFLAAAFAGYFLSGPVLAIILGGLAVASVLIWHSLSTNILLKRLEARLLTEAGAPSYMHRMFLNDASEMVKLAGMPRVRFYMIDTDLPLAFSLGTKGPSSGIIVTSGLFKTLTRAEISAVVAHELGHIHAGDRGMTAFWLSLSGLISPFTRSRKLSRRTKEAGAVLSSVKKGIHSRAMGPECRADAFAAKLRKDPASLASAIRKLERGVRSAHWEGLERTPTLASVATVNPVHARISYESPEYSPMAHRVAELSRLVVPEAKAA